MHMNKTTTRRSLLRCAGAGLAATAASGAVFAQSDSEWTAATSPVDGQLNDVVQTSTGAYVVGDAGVVLERTTNGWQTVIQDGPSSNGNNLRGAGVTDDGDRLWYVGASGAIGEYDVTTGSQVADRSAPNDVTNNFNDVAVVGPSGDANVYIAGDSGKIYYSFDNGDTWDESTPGSGSAINAVDFHGPQSGHAIDANQSVFETTDGGTYESIGIEDADVDFFGLDSDGLDDVWVVGAEGTVYRWDGTEWTSESIAQLSLRDVEIENGGVAVGDSGGAFDRSSGSWSQTTTPGSQNLSAVVMGSPSVAVGAGGTILERQSGNDDGDDGNDDEPSVADYANENGIVDITGLRTAIDDFVAGDIDIGLFRDVIDAFVSGDPVT